MSTIIDLGGAPAEEECAQLGQTIDFERVNRFEVSAYRVAIIARHGEPPEGCKLEMRSNRHDFGTYRTLSLSSSPPMPTSEPKPMSTRSKTGSRAGPMPE